MITYCLTQNYIVMRYLVLACLMALGLTSCNAQVDKKDQDNSSALQKENSEMKEPRGSWRVNKEVDENGNLIRYDSIYTYSFGNINGQQMPQEDLDSAMASFRKYMKNRMPSSFSPEMWAPFENDSITNSFFERGFFENHWNDFFPDLQQQLKQMDSLHQQFFQHFQQGVFPPEQKKEEQKKL